MRESITLKTMLRNIASNQQILVEQEYGPVRYYFGLVGEIFAADNSEGIELLHSGFLVEHVSVTSNGALRIGIVEKGRY